MSRSRLIALLLAFSTLVVFLPAGRFGFLDFDDNDYVTENPVVQDGLTLAGFEMGAHDRLRRQLASADMDFAHGRLHAVRAQSRRAPFRQRALSRRQRGAAVHVAIAADRQNLAVRLRGRAVRLASTSRRIRRLDRRTQGCVEHVFRAAGALELYEMVEGRAPRVEHGRNESVPRPATLVPRLLARAVFLRARPSVQADARHAAVRFPAAGFLAAPASSD